MEVNQFYNMDCRDALKGISDNSIDSVVTDPPYELGFMGKKWDSSGIAYDVNMWREVLRVLKPGGFLLSFGGTRTYHRMVCAIEDAGFEIRDSIDWVYGSGFPKSLDVGKAVDKLQGNERVKTGISPHFCEGRKVDNFGVAGEGTTGQRDRTLTKGASEWEGYGTALKPAHEPICVARKPIEGTVAQNVLKYGTGGINIDGCRVGSPVDTQRPCGKALLGTFEGQEGKITGRNDVGRFPANFIHDGSPEVISQFPITQSGKAEIGTGTIDCQNNGIYGSGKGGIITSCFADKGSASRFFKTCEFTEEDLPAFVYCAKASKSERDEGCDGMPESMKRNPMRSANGTGEKNFEGGFPDIKARNTHPTVKPVKLMQYLVKLVTPPDGTVLDPFMGSGTTGVACKKEGFNFVGIEMDAEHMKICEARINNAEPEPVFVDNQLELFT